MKPRVAVDSDRWTPRRRGGIFCSPACGGAKGFCTFAAYEKAMAGSLALVAELGPGWRAKVFENLGWHYCATSACGRITVHGDMKGFTAYLGPDSRSGGQWAESGKTAREAIDRTLAAARESLAWLMEPFEMEGGQVTAGMEGSALGEPVASFRLLNGGEGC